MSDAPARAQQFKLASLTLGVFLPTFIFSIGQGAIIPIIPLFAKDLGASLALASLVVAMRGVGQMLSDLPSGLAASRFGDKRTMIGGTLLMGVVAVGAALSGSPAVLGVLVLLMGAGWAAWQVGRLSYVSEMTPIDQRGRALALLGGANRAGTFVGPIIGGFLGKAYGLESAFYAQAVLALVAALLMLVAIRKSSFAPGHDGHGAGGRMLATISDQRGIFLSAGVPIMALQVLRQGRQIFLPLWGDSIGLDVAQIGLVYGASSFIDSWMFYPVGHVMDHWGRKWTAVPCLLLLSLSLVLLPLTTEIYAFLLVALLAGFGNGLGTGIVMTLGADFAPEGRRGEFLGVWRFVADLGSAGGPLAVSFIVGVASLGVASVASGGFGLLGAAALWLFVPETLRRNRPHVIPATAPPELETSEEKRL